MIKVKLLPRGKKHQITYRIVIAEDRSKFDGKFIDDLGFYTPQTKTLSFDKEKLFDWQKKGAQLTLGVDKLLNPDKYPKKIKVKKEEKNKEIKTETVSVKETKVEEVVTEEKVEGIETMPTLSTVLSFQRTIMPFLNIAVWSPTTLIVVLDTRVPAIAVQREVPPPLGAAHFKPVASALSTVKT